MMEEFIEKLFTARVYTPELVILYIITGILAGLTRLAIRSNYKTDFKSWWNDGTLSGAMIVSIAGALLFDNNFVWAFLGGYFVVYVLAFIQKKLDGAKKEEK
jgi:predicted Co/Zn/Cd cation transporter (cation efflux family)